MLADPHCELLQSLAIDYDLIEVKDDVCWSVTKCEFIESPSEARQIGKVSPRCFCAYDSATEAEPYYFREILGNSLSASEVATFCEDLLRLFNYKVKKRKDKVPFLVGASVATQACSFQFKALSTTETLQRSQSNAHLTRP